MPERDLDAAVAAGVMAGESAHGELLRSIVNVARAIFAARAASITLLDEATNELVFEAVSGEGSESLVGTRFPANAGVAGFVAAARQTLVIDDLAKDPRFARDVAADTGYVPQAMVAAPLLRGDRVLGVLSVLDREDDAPFGLEQMQLLELFADQASLALDVVQSARAARRALTGEGDEMAVVNRVAATLHEAEGPRREAALRLLAALEELLTGQSPGQL